MLRRVKDSRFQQDIIERMNTIKKAQKEPVKKQKQDVDFKIYESRFKDVIGLNRQKKILLKQISNPINKLDMFHKLNLKPMTGLILYGPAGTGKTALLKAISGELKIPMAYISLRDVRDKYVGGSERNLGKYFDAAKANEPCILFFDEIDSLGGARDDIDSEGAGTEKKDTVTQFLMEVSNLHDSKDKRVALIGATNMPWAIDKALTRSGRIEVLMYVPPPNFWDRKKMFKYYLNVNMEYTGHIDWNVIALATCDYSGADIEKVCKVVKLNIIDQGKGIITTRAIQKVLKSKDEGKSSLDEFYINSWHNYVKRPIYKKNGKEKILLEAGGKFDKGDLEIYKEFVKDVKRHMQYRTIIKLTRFLGRGF